MQLCKDKNHAAFEDDRNWTIAACTPERLQNNIYMENINIMLYKYITLV